MHATFVLASGDRAGETTFCLPPGVAFHPENIWISMWYIVFFKKDLCRGAFTPFFVSNVHQENSAG